MVTSWWFNQLLEVLPKISRRIILQTSVKTTSPENHYSFWNILKADSQVKADWKRICDIIFGTIFGIISLPIILVFAILISWTQRASILQAKRVGYMESQLRSLSYGQCEMMLRRKLEPFELKKWPAVTSVGRFMRKTRVDELPQFWALSKEIWAVGPVRRFV